MPIRSRRAHALLVLLLCAVACAATTACDRADALPIDFQGEVDSDGPLIIDPGVTDDPVTTTLQSAAVSVYFIERMPQTKSVTSITLGDYGQGSCSGEHPTAHLLIRTGDVNDYNASQTQIAYTDEVALPETPGRITWHFEWISEGGSVLLMRSGHAYAFQISISGCSTFRQTTWAPIEPKFETPNETCLSALPFGPNAAINAKRVWHDALTLPNPGCVNFLTDRWQ